MSIATEVVAVEIQKDMWVICTVDQFTGIPSVCFEPQGTCPNCGRNENMCSAYPCLLQSDRF